jgi:hypothetical protein
LAAIQRFDIFKEGVQLPGGHMRLPQIFLFVVFIAAASLAQDTNFPVGPQYLIPPNNATILRPIATPSMSLNAGVPDVPDLPQIGPPVQDQPYVGVYEPAYQPNLFPIYYGYPTIPVIELSGTPARELPPSLNEAGFVALTDPQSLRQMGYGETPAQAASFWKTRKRASPRMYTNADIQRLPRS